MLHTFSLAISWQSLFLYADDRGNPEAEATYEVRPVTVRESLGAVFAVAHI